MVYEVWSWTWGDERYPYEIGSDGVLQKSGGFAPDRRWWLSADTGESTYNAFFYGGWI